MLGTVTLIIALLIQIGYTVFCLIKKESQPVIRSVIRMGAFGLFSLLLVFQVYEWGFRWILLFIFLTVSALMGAIYLIGKRNQKKPFRKSRVILSGIGGMLLLSLAMLPGIIFPQYQLPAVTGEYRVATVDNTYVDAKRIETFTGTGENRAITVTFWYPEDAAGTYPLLLFSHGAFGIRRSNESTYRELASHGYVVCSLDHSFHAPFSQTTDGKVFTIDRGFMQEVIGSNMGVYTNREKAELFGKWMKLRTEDLDFVMNAVLEKASGNMNAAEVKVDADAVSATETEIEADLAKVYNLIDATKIGVFGHSMGGAAAVGMVRVRDDIDAVINIDAPYFSELVYEEATDNLVASNQSYPTPLLNIYSDDVWVQLDYVPTYAANKVAEKNCREVYTMYFQGAKHMNLCDLPLVSPILAVMLQGGWAKMDTDYCLETMNRAILEFFDYKLKGEGRFTFSGTY